MADNVIKQGFLRKAFAADNRLSGLWDKIDPVKWFIFLVRSGTPYLEYYDKENDVFTGDPINSFSLNGCQAITYNLGRNTRNHFCIVLHDRVLELGCPSREIMLDWCRTLERSLKQLGILNTERGEHVYTMCPAVVFSGRKKEDEKPAGEGHSVETANGAQGSETPVQLRKKTDVKARFSGSATQEDDLDEGEYMDCVWPDSALHGASSPPGVGEHEVSDTSGDFVDEDFFLKFKKSPRKKAGRPADGCAVEEENGGELLRPTPSGTDRSSPKPVPAPRRLMNMKSQEETPARKGDSNNNECMSDCPPQCGTKEEGYLVMHTSASSKESPGLPAPHSALPQYVTADVEAAEQIAALSTKALEKDEVTVDLPLGPQQSKDIFGKQSASTLPVSPFDNDFNPFQEQERIEERSQVSGGDQVTDFSAENPYVPFPVLGSEAPPLPGESLSPVPGPRLSPHSASPGSMMAPQRSQQRDGNGSPPLVPLSPVPRMPPPVVLRQTTQEPACPIPRIPPPLVPRQGSSQNEPHPLPPRQPAPKPPASGALDPGTHRRAEERERAEQRTTQRKFVSNYSLEDEDSNKTVEEADPQSNYRTELMSDLWDDDSSSSVPPTLPPRQDSLPNHPISRLSPDFLRVQLPHRDIGTSSHRVPSPLHLDKGGVGGKVSPSTSELHSKNAAADETNPNMVALQSKNWAADETNPNMPPPLPPRPQGMLSPSQDNPPPLPPVRSRTVVDRHSRHQVVSDGEMNSARAEPRISSDGYLVQSSRQLSAKMRLDRSNSIHAVVSLKQSQVEVLREQKAMTGLMHQLAPTAAANGLALVDMLSAVWVAGWNQREYPSLHGKFHVGDQIVSINKVKVENSVMAAKMLKGSDKVEVVVRRIPYGEVFAIKRSAEGEGLGFQREGGTAEILYVDPNGLAAMHGLPVKAHMVLGLGNCHWVLTEINSRPLNLFFKEQEIEHRLYAVGKEISIVVQPSDFIFELKKKLKKIKNYKSFLVQ